jgi:hypothetical protein
VPHALVAINKRMIAPLFNATNPYAAIHQLLEADIVYVRDFTRPDAMSNEQLGQLAMIAHHCYRSHDLVLNCIHHLESRRAIASGSVHIYARTLHSSAQQSLQCGRKRRFGFSED